MTIRRSTNWCEDCQEESSGGHSSMCLTCGGTLTVRPSAAAATAAATSGSSTSGVSFRAMPGIEAFLPAQFTAADTADLLRGLRGQVRDTTALAQQAATDNANTDWQAIPAAILDPQNSNSNTRKRPTSQEALAKMPRETLTAKSPSLYHVAIQIRIQNQNQTEMEMKMEGVTGELGTLPDINANTNTTTTTNSSSDSQDNDSHTIQVQAPLWIPKRRAQRTGKEALPNSPNPSIVVLERGHGIPFVQKALAAQQAGATAIIVINDKAEPWPYCMKDSRTEDQKQGQPVTIPVVMISLANGQRLLRECKDNDTRSEDNNDNGNDNDNDNHSTASAAGVVTIVHNAEQASCVICRDELALGQTVLTLTNYCGHAFHEQCALQWLQQHNTCPYCRRTLPTDNPDDEQERRRQMTAQDNQNGTAIGTGPDVFYG